MTTSNPDNDNSELKTLVVEAVAAAKALLAYVDSHPGKLTELKTEFKAKFGKLALAQLMRLVF